MAQKRIMNIGLAEDGVYLASVQANGEPPELSAMNYIGDIVPDSLNRDDEDDSETDLKAQETGETVATLLSEVGTKKFLFSTWNFKTENLLKAFGGSVDAEGTWKAPTSSFRGDFYAMAYKSRADEETGLHFVMNYPKVLLKGKMEGIQQEGDGNKLQFSCTIFTPTDETTGQKKSPAVFMLIPTAPTNGQVDDTNDTFGWDFIQAFPNVTDYEFSEDGGNTWNDCTANPQPITAPKAIGDVQVRVKADTTSDTKHKAGFVLANQVAFT